MPRRPTVARTRSGRSLSGPSTANVPNLHKLAEVLIRLTLQETGESRAATLVPDTYRAATVGLAASEAAR